MDRDPLTAFTIHAIDLEAARDIATWRYEPPYDVYDFSPEDFEENVGWLLNPKNRYFSVWEAAKLIGYRCFGEDARVPGGDYSDPALDMGGGLRPDYTGRGLGASFMRSAIEFAKIQFQPTVFRVTVMASNQRALKVCERVGYRPTQSFNHPVSGRAFKILMQEAGV